MRRTCGYYRTMSSHAPPSNIRSWYIGRSCSAFRKISLLIHHSVTMLFSLFLTAVATLTTQVYGYANPLACSGTCTNTHDPSIIRRASDGTYFRFATGGGIAIHKASSVQGPWTYQGYALASGSTINNSGSDDMWVCT